MRIPGRAPSPHPPDEAGADRSGARREVGERDALLAALDEMPPMGPVAMRVLELTNDPRSSAADFARVISRDQGLAARVLRTCNSSFYARASEVQSLSQAVVVLGQRAVRNLVFFHSLPVGRTTGGKLREVEHGLWMHSISTAIASRLVAQQCAGVDVELAFLAGLFHDLGRMLLLHARSATYEDLARGCPGGRPDLELERTHLGLTHTEAGEAAARRWRLGEDLALVALQHHQPPQTVPPLVAVVIVADHLDAAGDDAPMSPVASAAAELLGLGDERLVEVCARLRHALQQEEQFFRLAA